jgi:hypothetical protein
MISHLFVQCCIVAAPLIVGLSIIASHNNCVSALPVQWFAGLFFLITVFTSAISFGFGFDLIFSNSFELSIASFITLLVLLTIRLCFSNRVIGAGRFDALFDRSVGSFYEAIRLLIVLLLLVYGLSEVIKVPVNEWDAVFIWFNKAKSIYYGDLWNKIPFAEYPNSGPLIWAFLMRIFGQTEQVGRLIFPTIYVVCCWQFSYFSFKKHQQFLYFLTCWSFLSFHLFKNWTWNGYQDNFIACTAAMAVYVFIQYLNKADAANVSCEAFRDNKICNNGAMDKVAYLFCGMLYLIKNEGLVLGAIICLTYLIYSNTKKISNKFDIKKIVINIVLFFVPIAFQLLIKATYGINPLQVQGDAFSLSTDFFIQERLMRLLPIAVAFMTYVWHNLFIYSICLLSIYCSIRYYKNIVKNIFINSFLITIIVLHGLFIVSVFIMTNQNLEWHLMTAYGRLMSQHLMIIFALTLWNLSIIINNIKVISDRA